MAQPDMLPPTLEGPLITAMKPLEPLVWKDAWQAREALEALADRSEQASRDEQVAYHLLLAQSLLYMNDEGLFAAVVEAGVDLIGPNTPVGLRDMVLLLDGVRKVRRGDYAEAMAQFQARLRDDREVNATATTVMVRAELSYAYTLAGQHENAEDELQRAYRDAVALGDDFLVAVVNEVYGVLYTYIDDYDQAARHYRLALGDYETLGYLAYIAEAVYGLAIADRDAGNYQEALAGFERYRAMTEQSSDLKGRFMALYGLGSTLADRGDCERALAAIGEALDVRGPEDYKAELLKRAAICHGRAGDELAAREALARAQTIVRGIPELLGTRWEIGLLRSEAEMEAALGYFDAAYQAMVAFQEQKSALQEKNVAERREARRQSMESERQALRIDLLQEQARVRSLEIERQRQDMRQQRLLTTLIACVGLLVLGIVLWRLRDMRRLKKLSISDPLTGIGNRRHVFAQLSSLLEGLDPEKGELSLLLLDVDDFKRVNDRHGHPVGDRVLQTIANVLSSLLRPGDELARVGGEEFLLALPRTDREGAIAVAQRICDSVRAIRIAAGDDKQLTITVSVGVASLSPSRASIEGFYAAADKALYAAKAGGKDRIQVAD